MTGEPAEVSAELVRLRKLEQSLQAERERIRAAAAGEVLQLQTALRETAARAAQRERELQALQAQLQRGAGGPRLRRPRIRAAVDTTGAVERLRAAFERERRQLEERARAVAQTELRQRTTQAQLDAEIERIALASGDPDSWRLSADLRAAEDRIALLEQELRDHQETRVALEDARSRLAELERPAPMRLPPAKEQELARREEEVAQREVELSLVHRRISEEERRLQERAWRTGALERRRSGAIEPRPAGEHSFSEGWRLLSRGRDREPPEPADWGGGNW